MLKISIIYTHLFYLIIILAAIWYQRKAVWLALFFGILHIEVTYLIHGSLSIDPVFRAIMLCTVAFIVGSLVQCLTIFRDEDIRKNHELEKVQRSILIANKKLNLLSSITRHDILNQLTALLGYLEISLDICEEPELKDLTKKEQHIAETIWKQIEFTRHYQDIGVRSPIWHNLIENFQKIQSTFHHDTITLQSTLTNIEIYADPLFPLICQNLVDNSTRHGERVSNIRFSTEQDNTDLICVYEDDGIGVPDNEKIKIFERGFGKHTGMGLFLVQEILAITELSIRETGVYGEGVRFEIRIPKGSYRVSSSEENT
ncbi:MAG: HAMP domain-containing sensor histidine kinase [Methanobacteriota archaeon]